ncbi:penicillin-binding transpeptidase domain-containing protein [Clostridium sp. D2Q-11]|uniref:Penicillin-binding transpeptidase domain-containing protein n=1 Tax=Anaeromonas frigoriresistens TaxID=2683708 RepID=A0A942UXB9_9FIRM|nr:penicillin-binding transpeptidase domain-containing protein [Anaeromonas frigoriresistens]MBS4538534.1 penicillin-binding transpeptidase domain-containing protein [Anaeromonas frigoriresistens]
MIRHYKNKLTISLGIILILMISIIFTGCDKQTAKEAFNVYKEKWENNNYEEMYEMLSTDSKEYISKEEFIDRYKNIYDGIGADNISIELNDDKDEEENPISFSIKMDTTAGTVDINDYQVNMIEEEVDNEKVWAIEWNESLIFPQMSSGDIVRVNTLTASRGEIYDRNDNGLAVNGTILSLGIHPKVFEENKESNILKMAEILDIDASRIEDKLSKNTNPDHFVPIVKISASSSEILSQLSEIDGVKSEKLDGRIYPAGEALGALIGYIKPITAEELEELKEEGYTTYSLIGKTGLEEVYEKRLRAKDGKEIYISKRQNGEEFERVIIAKSQPVDGENIKLTIDSDLQKEIYKEMNKDAGASTAIDPKTGEILALVSSPSFDSNLFSTYITNSQREEWNSNDVDEFQNRFNNAYSPGSTFKLITAAIGLDKGVIDPNEKINIEGKQWQPDGSWGDYKVTRVSEKKSQVDLTDAFIYSDNIYFARAALDIGGDKFMKDAEKFGFSEKLPIDYPIQKSQIANDEVINKDTLLASTGYGQGEVLMSPLHVSLVYSSIVNDGNMMNPLLEVKEDLNPEIWKENVVSKESITTIKEGLIQAIENNDGTGNDAKIQGIELAGKTGTAELKKSLEDKDSEENGWFVAMNTEDPKIVVSMIIEKVKDRGQSHYVVPKVKNIIEYYLNNK